MNDEGMLKLVSDHMEGGFLENIIDMFKQDRGLYSLVPGLMSDERSRVRIGTVSLIETLNNVHGDEIKGLISDIASLLNHNDPSVRADAAYLLGAMGHKEAIPFLQGALNEKVPPVREVIEETIADLSEGKQGE